MTVDRTLPVAELARLADEAHRQAIRYQRQADRMRKEQRRRTRQRRTT